MGGANSHNTRIIMAYNPCKNRNVNLGTTYQQRRQYFITKKKNITCPLVFFRRDLIKQINEWRAEEDRIVLFMFHNKHITEGALGKAFGDREGLSLREAIIHHTGKGPGAIFFRGSKTINALWVSLDIDISNACVMLFSYGVGDHQAYIVDIPIKL